MPVSRLDPAVYRWAVAPSVNLCQQGWRSRYQQKTVFRPVLGCACSGAHGLGLGEGGTSKDSAMRLGIRTLAL